MTETTVDLPRSADELQANRLNTLHAFYEAEDRYIKSGGNDFSEIAATLDKECVIYQPASLPYGGRWQGHQGFEAWMKAFSEQWSSLIVLDSQIFVVDDRLFSRSTVSATARRTQENVEWPLLQMFRFRDSKILELEPFYWDTAALLPVLTP